MKKNTETTSKSSKQGARVSRKSGVAHEAATSKKPKPDAKVEATAETGLWDELKGMEVDMFGLPGQFLHMHATVKSSDKDACILHPKSDSVISTLEDRLGSKYEVVAAPPYVTISRKK